MLHHVFIFSEMTEVSSSQAGDLETSSGISVVHMPSLSQPIQVQSVIHSNTPSVIQTAGPNVQTIQVVRVSTVVLSNRLKIYNRLIGRIGCFLPTDDWPIIKWELLCKPFKIDYKISN